MGVLTAKLLTFVRDSCPTFCFSRREKASETRFRQPMRDGSMCGAVVQTNGATAVISTGPTSREDMNVWFGGSHRSDTQDMTPCRLVEVY
jgi:hypothetical protein